MTPTATQEATYRAALELVARIDEDLARGTGHYYTKGGLLLYSLDQVVQGILDNRLMDPDEEEVMWVPEIVAA